MKILWTQTAIDHLQSIHDEIQHASPVDAKRMIHRITRRPTLVSDPQTDGARVTEFPSESVREVFEGPYRLVYLVKPERFIVLAVVRGVLDGNEHRG